MHLEGDMTERDKAQFSEAAGVASFQVFIAVILFFVMFSASEAAFASVLLVGGLIAIFALVGTILHLTREHRS
jgi:hypothetical protein